MLTELTREVIRIAEADGTKLELSDPFDPNAFTRDADQSAADRAFETIFNHRPAVPRNTAVCGAISLPGKRKTELDTLLLTVLDAGVKRGVVMRSTRLLAQMVQEIEAGKRQQTWQNFDELQSRTSTPPRDFRIADLPTSLPSKGSGITYIATERCSRSFRHGLFGRALSQHHGALRCRGDQNRTP